MVADNGSTDGSIELAQKNNARVVSVETKGYGAALRGGCESAKGKYVIMGDADDSYDFSNLMPFLTYLREGYDLVMGNRFRGGIEKGAMPWLHMYIGNPALSFVGRLFFNSKVHDFHCGLRGYNRDRIMAMDLHTTGMEYASEMVVRAELSDYKIAEVPTTLKKDGRSRAPHLRSFRDGWRHLKFLFMYAPNWLYLFPGIILFVSGLILSVILILGQFNLFGIIFSIHTLLYASAMVVSGITIIGMFIMVKIYAYNHGYIPRDKYNWNTKINEDALIFGGILICMAGIIAAIYTFALWESVGFSELEPELMMRIAVPAAALFEIGIEITFFGFMAGIMRIK